MLRFLGFLFLILVTLGVTALLEGGNPLSLVQLSAFVLAFFLPVFATLAVWSGKAWGSAFATAFGLADSEARKSASRLWGFFASVCGLTAGLGLVIGVIFTLEGIGVPERLGAGLALALAAPFYSLCLALIALVLRARSRD